MKTWYPFRFKIESEFLAEFGEDWRNDIHMMWNGDGNMDYLYGQPYPHIDIYKNQYWLNNVDNWSVSWDMLTENKPLVPNYEKKIINREL